VAASNRLLKVRRNGVGRDAIEALSPVLGLAESTAGRNTPRG
jgi:hypothetical protein